MAIILMLIIAVAAFSLVAKNFGNTTAQYTSKPQKHTMRCPNCGAQATISGNTWHCDWCGDSGFIRKK